MSSEGCQTLIQREPRSPDRWKCPSDCDNCVVKNIIIFDDKFEEIRSLKEISGVIFIQLIHLTLTNTLFDYVGPIIAQIILNHE